jgi:hypothetical protein
LLLNLVDLVQSFIAVHEWSEEDYTIMSPFLLDETVVQGNPVLFARIKSRCTDILD